MTSKKNLVVAYPLSDTNKFHFEIFIPKKLKPYISLCLFLLIMISAGDLEADDPGITKARLIQQSDTTYTFEADVAQVLLPSIKTPILPEGFRFIDFAHEDRSGWITLKSTIICSERSFSPEDEIILPWDREGVDITVQLLNGAVAKGLFRNSLGGIHIPFENLIPRQKSTFELLKDSLQLGLRHSSFLAIHLLMIFMIIWTFPSYKSLMSLAFYSAGQGLAMVISELFVTNIELLYADLLLIILIISIALSIAYKKDIKFISLALLCVGLVHSLAFINEIQIFGYDNVQNIKSVFAFNAAIDIVHFSFASLLIPILFRVQKQWKLSRHFAYVAGSIGIFILLIIFEKNIPSGERDILSVKH